MARTVVIGGGASGIAAARTLHDAGHDVVLVEASDRLGGRARSLPLRHCFPVGPRSRTSSPPSRKTMSTPVAAGFTPPSAILGLRSRRRQASLSIAPKRTGAHNGATSASHLKTKPPPHRRTSPGTRERRTRWTVRTALFPTS
ncbi:FAD-dependent oxidoreductase [Sphingomonas aurantiaca]|uniref:FAD-dependent oxidoreductase n=1 Tax=Sphingomonas aurantiaca TaxID=185949 RepID=UPI002FE41AE9